jgi:hypothetical protein
VPGCRNFDTNAQKQAATMRQDSFEESKEKKARLRKEFPDQTLHEKGEKPRGGEADVEEFPLSE